MIDVSEVVTDTDFSQSFLVYRSSGQFIKGRWTEDTPQQITMYGVISIASAKELNQFPEGDRIRADIVIHSVQEIFTTRTDDEGEGVGTSDQILWRSEFYKILNVKPYVDYGYWSAIAERVKGS